jgi:amino acid transporter
MYKGEKISLTSALFININIIIGAGIFLNIKRLAEASGRLSFLSYVAGTVILLPFVYILAKLAQHNPVSGGIYIYSKKYISPFIGFISGWSYFIGKTVSTAFLAYAFTNFFHKNIPALQQYPIILLSCLTIATLITLNIFGMHIGGKIQFFFIVAKSIPILAAIIFGVLTILKNNNLSHLPASGVGINTLLSTIPIAIYSLIGFEITCAIGHMVKKPEKNLFKTIFGSFLVVAGIFTLFQGIVVLALGQKIFLPVYPLTTLAGRGITALVFASVIAGSFGILTSNCWNLHALAKNNHLPFAKILTAVSKKGVPWVALLVEGIIASLMLIISKNQTALQSMAVFGVVISFLLSSVAAFRTKTIKLPKIISLAAIISCCYILFLCFQKIQMAGVSLPYLIFIFGGLFMALLRYK